MRFLTVLSLGLVGAIGLALQEQADLPVRGQDLLGVWKVAYEPTLPGVSEVDDGYLVLEPQGSYLRTQSNGDTAGTVFERGTFTYTAGVVQLVRTGAHLSDGTDPDYVESSEVSRLYLQPRATVVLFDQRHCLVETLVLTASPNPRDLNYSWALVLGGAPDHAPRPAYWEPCAPAEARHNGPNP